MLKMTQSACVEAPVSVVWDHLSRLDQIHVWTDVIHRVEVGGTCSRGVGTERTCELRGSRSVHERFVEWREGESFTYESVDAPLMKLARNRWSLRAEGDRTVVTSEAEMQLRGGMFGHLLGFVLVPLLALVLPNPLAKFKFWVENGRPFEGRASRLPRPSAAC
jgi:ligand-binding SRPBCC domain-containing protein